MYHWYGKGQTTEKERVEKKQEECICPLSRIVHHNFARDGYIESRTVAVSKQDFQAWKQKYSFLVMVYLALFNNIFKALNLS